MAPIKPTLVDIIIDAGWVLPIAPVETTVLCDTSIIIADTKILDIIPTASVCDMYKAPKRLDRTSCVVMPGLINAHTHAGMTLMRGRGDDEPLLQWLQNTIWPIEAVFASDPKFTFDGSLLACADMMRNGVTTFADMYFFPTEVAKAISMAGMRAILGMITIDVPTAFASCVDEYIAKGHAARDAHKDNPLISWAYTPHAPYTVPTELWARIREMSEENGLRIHTHIHETHDECAASAVLDRDNPACHKSEHACRPLADLDRIGIVNDRLVAVHMVHLTDDEIELCASRGVNIVCCPTSNAKLASGFCPVHKLAAAGINVALGTDSACSNNSLDIRAEMKLAALIAKSLSGDATAVPAATALRMATINGARAFGIDDVTGSLEVGKAADVISIEVNTTACNTPVFNAHAAVVYSSAREDVRDVIVNGKILILDREYCTIDVDQVLQRAKHWQKEINTKFPMQK